MSDDQVGWVDFSVPDVEVRFRYPSAAADGEPVQMDQFRAHFRTMDSAQVYFEVSRQAGLTVRELCEREAALLRANSNHHLSEVESVSLAGCNALRFDVTFPDRERVFHYIDRPDGVYRVVYDPRSPINEDIIRSIEFT